MLRDGLDPGTGKAWEKRKPPGLAERNRIEQEYPK